METEVPDAVNGVDHAASLKRRFRTIWQRGAGDRGLSVFTGELRQGLLKTIPGRDS
jgi:hypothetical protein